MCALNKVKGMDDYMEQNKIAKLIKQIRKDNNLTQKQFADKYNVTYQAVSKWENGINLPDMYLLKQISSDFNISIDNILDGEYSKKNNKIKIVCVVLIIILVIVIVLSTFFIKNSFYDFNFNTLSSDCSNFNVSGNIAYNDKKSSIFITRIEYCGNNDKEKYKEIECSLYESNNNIDKKISYCAHKENFDITLKEYLQTVTIVVDDYKSICKDYSKNNLYLNVSAKDSNDKITTYKIPIILENNCKN